MKLERAKNAKRSIIFGLFNKIVTLILPFIVRTILIKKLGSDYLGLSSLFTSILQVLSLSELGFSSAIIFSMYKPIADDDTDTICALQEFYRFIYRIIGCTIMGIGLCLIPFLPHLISGSYPTEINLYAIYLLYLINTSLSYFLFAYKSSILNAYQRIDIISNINTITQGSMYILQIAILYITQNYYIFILMLPVFTLVNNIINSVIVQKLYPQYICKGKLDKILLGSIKKQITGLIFNKLCQTSRNSLGIIFVSSFLGLTVTAIYSNYYYIMYAIIGIISVLTNAMVAGIGNSIIIETIEKNYDDLKKINFIYMIICGWCTICLACLYQPFMKVWVGKDLMFAYPVVILLSAYFYVLKMGDIRCLYSDAAGLWWENRYRAIIESVSNLVLIFIFVQIWGIYGIISATLISLLIINFGFGSQIVFKYYFKNNRIREYFLLHAKYASVTILVCIITYYVCSIIPFEGLVGLGFKGLICCLLPNILYIAIYFKTKDYERSVPWLLSVLHLQKKLSWLISR